MQRMILIAIVVFGSTTAHAQTATNTGTDPLSAPTTSLPSTSSFSSTSPTATTSGAATTATGSPTVNGSVATTGLAGGGTGSIDASSGRSSQAPLELPGEGLEASTQSASTTAAAPAASSTICPPSIPSTDGGSANITEIDGFSPSGC